jgi:hypothetical protein
MADYVPFLSQKIHGILHAASYPWTVLLLVEEGQCKWDDGGFSIMRNIGGIVFLSVFINIEDSSKKGYEEADSWAMCVGRLKLHL